MSATAKACTGCNAIKSLNEFWNERGKRDGKKSRCSVCARADNKKLYDLHQADRVASTQRWRAKHPELVKAQMIRQRKKIKKQILAAYGGQCTCCGETNDVFLTLEHINGGGRAHQRRCGGSAGVFRDVIKSGFPADYTVLCMNCNWATRGGGICPHKR